MSDAERTTASGGGAPGYGRDARFLSVGIATTGLVTFAYFAVASHVLEDVAYKRIALMWSVMFIVISIIYRPVEQLLSRMIAARRARGLVEGHPLRVPALIQLAFASVFATAALALRAPLRDDLLDGSTTLYWILVGGVLAYAASYFARGWLAGHRRFFAYGGLVLLESCSRFLFALAVAVGIAEGQSAVALGIAAAPCVSLAVIPFAARRQDRRRSGDAPEPGVGVAELSMGHGTGFASAVLAIMIAEQALLNAPVLSVDATAANHALAGFVFNVLLIARAPLQLFQAIQTSLLPHLAALDATAERQAFARAIGVTVRAVAAFAAAVALVLLIAGPTVMDALFGGSFEYGRVGLVLVALGMGCHLVSGTLNQAALARGRAGSAALAWGIAATAFVAWVTLPVVSDELLRVEVGYLGATAMLAGLLLGVYRRRETRSVPLAAR